MKRVLIFGSNSTLAKKIKSFLKNDYLVTEVAQKKINFSKKIAQVKYIKFYQR